MGELTWVGHGTVLIEMDGRRLLVDPVLGRRVGLLRRLVPPPEEEVAAGIDAVLISHLHGDHADVPSLRRVGATVQIVAPAGAGRWLARRGFRRVCELRPGGSTQIGSTRVTATPAAHDGGRWRRAAEPGAIGFFVEGDYPVYVAGDTDLYPEMAALAGRVDVALLPVSGWGPSLGPGHMDAARAAEAAAIIRPAVAIPIHWGTLGLPWRRRQKEAATEPPRAFAAAVAGLAREVDVRILDPGERITLPRGGAGTTRPGMPPE